MHFEPLFTATSSQADINLMKQKMEFFGNRLSFHKNVLNFIGALPNHDSGKATISYHSKHNNFY